MKKNNGSSAIAGTFDLSSMLRSVRLAFLKLGPVSQIKNPVMFLVYAGAILCTGLSVIQFAAGQEVSSVSVQIIVWLWFTLLFANFAESIAETQGKAKADSLKRMRKDVMARRLTETGEQILVSVSMLNQNDVVVCKEGDIVPGDGEVVSGIASVDESAITGESAPVIRESGGDRSAVTGGTRIVSDQIHVRITREAGNTFIDGIIKMVEGSSRKKTPNEIALTILLACLSMIFLVAVVTLYPFSEYISGESGSRNTLSVLTLTALLVCLIPTTIGSLLSAIGISGVTRLLAKNTIALSGKAVETSGDVDVLMVDKTGTITFGNRMASDLIVAEGTLPQKLAESAFLSSFSDETPEGRSIIKYINLHFGLSLQAPEGSEVVPFSAKTRMSGLDFMNGKSSVRKGSVEAIRNWVTGFKGTFPHDIEKVCNRISMGGGTPLVVAEGPRVLGVIHLKDVIKPGIRERFRRLSTMGIRTVMVTGDNPLTAAAIAAESGVSDFIAEADPARKLERIRAEQSAGHLVAYIGDGTNDAPALAQADVGVAMSSGTQIAREAGNMIDFDNDPAKLIDIVETGKQLLMTRGSLTTFSIANDIAKYFAILPALFMYLYGKNGGHGPLGALNIMHLATPQSAILSAIIFNALIIIALIPLALRGVKYKPLGASALLRRNLLIYGLGGIVTPFLGIKAIDMAVHFLGLA